MYYLTIHHEFERHEMGRIRCFLALNGFTLIRKDSSMYTVRFPGQTMKGDDPDQLTVNLLPSVIAITADYACYRGKVSIYATE